MRFNPLGDIAMTAALRQALPDVGDADIVDLVAMGEGAPGLALQRRGLNLAQIDADLTRLSSEGDALNRIRVGLASKLALKAAQPRYELFLKRVPRHIAASACTLRGPRLATALNSYERARELADTAVTLSLDPAMVTFELAGLVAALAPPPADAPRRTNG